MKLKRLIKRSQRALSLCAFSLAGFYLGRFSIRHDWLILVALGLWIMVGLFYQVPLWLEAERERKRYQEMIRSTENEIRRLEERG